MSIRQSGPQASFIPLPTACCQSVVIPDSPRQPVEVRSYHPRPRGLHHSGKNESHYFSFFV